MPKTTSGEEKTIVAGGVKLEKLVKETGEKETLLSINHDIASIKDKSDILHHIHPKLVQLFGTEDIFICQLEKQNQAIIPFLRSIGEKKHKLSYFREVLESSFPVNDRFIHEILHANKPLICDFEEVCSWPSSGSYMSALKRSGVRESISAALMNGDDLLGVITFWSDRKGHFNSHHQYLLGLVAEQISMVVSNIVFNNKISSKERENEILLSISHAIATIRDKSDLIKVIQKTLRTTLRFSDIAITRFNLEKGTFKVFLEYCEATSQHPDFNSIAFAEYPIADGIHDMIMNASETVVLKVNQLLKEGRAHIVFLADAGIKELAGIKLRHNDKIIGTLVLLSTEENSFPQEHRRIIDAASHHFATAMVNIIYNQEILQRSNENEILLTTSSQLASIRNKKDLVPLLKKQLEGIPFYNDISIAKVDDDGKTFSSFVVDSSSDRRSDPGSPEMEAAHHSFPDGVFEIALQSQAPVFFDIVKLTKQKKNPPYIKFIADNKIVDMAGISLHDRNRAIGVLFVFAKEKKLFDENHLSLVQAIADQLGTTVANLMANEKIERQLHEISHYKEQLEEEKQYLQEEVSKDYSYEDIVGKGAEMQKVFQQLARVASANTTVLILGETGTGKELIARAIHNSSSRRNNLMVKVNCAALPPNLIESELLGHEKGSFTGATEKRIGKFELANNGTLFLDEIGELPVELQPKLLRAIQEKEIDRIGGRNPIKINVRIIAATNRELQKDADEGRFRQDLYYRLNVFPITLPPLRDRKEDIPTLVSYFIQKYAKNAGKNTKNVSGKTMKSLLGYSWPGNIRELEHLMERSVLLSNSKTIREIHLPPAKTSGANSGGENEVLKTHKENERDHIIRVLNRCNGKIFGPGGAAAVLGLQVSTLNSKIKKLGIKKSKLYN